MLLNKGGGVSSQMDIKQMKTKCATAKQYRFIKGTNTYVCDNMEGFQTSKLRRWL